MKRKIVLEQGTGQPPEPGRYWTSRQCIMEFDGETWGEEGQDLLFSRPEHYAKMVRAGDTEVLDDDVRAPAWWLGPLPQRFEHAIHDSIEVQETRELRTTQRDMRMITCSNVKEKK